jgi:diphosphomevalonate decarboxylase
MVDTRERVATAIAHPNIAFIKYWGNRDETLRLPQNSSLSMNLAGLETVTTAHFTADLQKDRLLLNDQPQSGVVLDRMSQHLDQIRAVAGSSQRAHVISKNNFPTGTGIASSASGFAALTAAACAALGLDLSEKELSTIARLGSGSASRSIPGGFVEWHMGYDHTSSYAESIAPPDHWHLVDLVTIVSSDHKAVGSTDGHALASTSPLQVSRVKDTERRLQICRSAILNSDFESFAKIVEHDTLMMHGVMMTSTPTLIYWLPATIAVITAVQSWRRQGIPACFTIDAGPNVHVITDMDHVDAVRSKIAAIPDVSTILEAHPGGPVQLTASHLQ